MDIPSRHMDAPRGLPSMESTFGPSIMVGDGPSPARGMAFGPPSNRRGFSSFAPSLLSSIPMAIPNARTHDEPPPALPPPRYVPIDGPVAEHPVYHEQRHRHDTSMSAGSGYFGSLNGSLSDGLKREVPRWSRSERDEGYGSMSSTRSQNSIPTRFGVHHDKFQFRPSVDAYDSAQLQKLNSHRGLNNRSPPQRPLGSAANSIDGLPRLTTSASERLQTLKPLSLPTRTKQQSTLLDSPSRFTETPSCSALSPLSMPFGGGLEGVPGVGARDFERSPISRPSRTNSGDDMTTVSTQSSCEMDVDDTDFPMEETSRLRGFHIDDQTRSEFQQATGLKRRASSPPGGDEPYGCGSGTNGGHGLPSISNDMLKRREAGASRGSPTPRLSSIPQGSSMSARSPKGGRCNSIVSTLSLAASSLSSMASFNHDRRSPNGGLSPNASGLSPTEPSSCGSPFGTPLSLAASPRSSISSRTAPHSRTLSDQNRQQPQPPSQPAGLASPRKLSDLPKSSVAKLQGFIMCDCCPKKPKKFDSQEALSVHEAEKQYECTYCGNRFKNKNEAERHQNSLHVRRHSWSCSALTGWARAFHESPNQPGRMDTCGYCGKEFTRSGGGGPWVVTEQDWEERVRHLTDAHKFRECNQSKKFYRADHFRQHLKHSHAGTSGKWTNMLENACMLEEEPPMPMSSSMGIGIR